MKKFVIMLSAALPLCTLAGAQQDLSQVQITSQHVAGNIHMLQGAGGNIGASVGEDGILIVDDQFAPLAEKIRARLQDLIRGDLKFILNTHWHGDHTGGNAVLGSEATIIAHTNVRKRLSSEQRSSFFNRVTPPAPKEAWPVITFDHSVSVHFNGEEIKAIHFPQGHTDGDSIIFFTGSNVVHMGDHFFKDRFPFVDLDSGGNVLGFTENVGKIIEQIPADAKIIPGHGELSTVEDLRRFHAMLVETSRIVREARRAGKSLEAIKAQGLPDKYQAWGSGFISQDRWIELIYRSLEQVSQ